MAIVDVKQIIESGVHFGHRASRWHPKMKPYIFGKRNLIHIVDVRETIKGLVRASNFLTNLASAGKDVIFLGTKRQAKSLIMKEAQRTGMHWISERWLGGTLTNFHTIRQRLERLEELEALEADGRIEQYSKKRISTLRRERRKITRNLEGLRNLKQLPGALVVIDIRREHIAVKEARAVGVPVVALVDTDCDPREADIVIPGNDDAYRSIQIVLRILADAIVAGRKRYEASQAAAEKAAGQEESARPKGPSDAESRAAAPVSETRAEPSSEPASPGGAGPASSGEGASSSSGGQQAEGAESGASVSNGAARSSVEEKPESAGAPPES